MKTKHSIVLLALGTLLSAASVQSQTVVVSDNYTVTTSGTGFALGSGVNTGINPPTTRITGTAAANLRYLQTVTTRAASKYDIGTSRLRIGTDNTIGRFTLSANGATAYDFGPAVGATYATPANPAIYEIRITMRNDATNTARMSFAISTIETDANSWDFGLQLYRVVGADAYTVQKRFDTASTGTAADINSPMITMQPGTTTVSGAGSLQSFLIRVTDAGQETVAPYNSRIQVSTNNGTAWQYDSLTNTTELTNGGFRFDGPARIIDFDQAGNSATQTGSIFYDSFSITSIQSPAPPTPVIWTGQSSIDSNWSSVENWGGTAPQAGQPIIFGGTARQGNSNDIVGLDAPYLSFTNGGFSITGNVFSVSSTISNVAGANTIGTPLSFSTTGPKIWNLASGSVLTLANTTTVDTNGDHTILGGGTLYSRGAMNIGQGVGSTANPPITVLEGAHIIDGAALTTKGGYRIGSAIGAGAQTILTNNATLAITATSGNLRVGDAANANGAKLTMDNSTLTLAGSVVFGIGYNSGSVATVTQNGGTVTAPLTSFSENAAATGSYTIKNGSLTTRVIRKNTAGGSASISFDNATLITAAGASNSVFFTGLNTAQIQAGGLTVDTESDVTVGQALSGTGGLTKAGLNTLTLTGANTFGGAITINAGAVSVGTSTTLPATATVNLNGGTLDLASSATVGALQYAGVYKAAGTYGAVGSGAAHENAQFTGTGILTVTGGGTSVTTVTSTSSSTLVGQAVGFTITVTGTGDGTIPDGTVDLFDNGTPIATGLVLTPTTGTSAEATYGTSTLGLGAHPITAVWAGNNSYGASTSAVYTQNVVQAPVLVSPTTASTVTADAGTNVTMTIVLQDSNGVSYQWSKGGVNLANGSYNNAATVSGSTAATLTLFGVKGANASPGDYVCIASNAAGTVTSAAVTLVVNDPAISVQPSNTVFECGTNGCLSVTAAGTTNANGVLLYQWFTPNASGTAITDATNSTLCFNNIHAGSAGSYVVVVSNAFGSSITSQVATVTVVDTTKPVLVGVPSSGTIDCTASIPDAPAVTATDTCDSTPGVTMSAVTNAGACAQSYNIVRTWTATDASANTSTGSQTITVTDTTAPVVTLTGASSITIQCHGGFSDPGYSAADTCAGATTVNVSGSVNPNAVGSYTLTYSSADPCGNGAATTRVVTVIDNTSPTLVGLPPANDTVECDAIPTAPNVTATDACDLNPSVHLSESTNPGTCAQSYTLIRTWTATDAAGNTATATQTISVHDSTGPVITLTGGASLTVECHGSFTDPGVTANDACAGSASVSTSGSVDADTTGVYTLTYSATDPCGNNSTATRVVHVSDSGTPTLVGVPADATVECDSIPDAANVTASDTCDANAVVTLSSATNSGACAQSYTIVRTWTATDAGGNTSTAQQSITVQDTTAPVISLTDAASLTIECHVGFTDPGVSANDGCAGVTTVNTIGSVDSNTAGDYTLTYSATDPCGNNSTATRVVHVSDTAAPTITANVGATTLCTGGSYSDPGATAGDTCGSVTVVTNGAVNGSIAGDYTITYTATDASGNNASATRVVTVSACSATIVTDPQSTNIVAGTLLSLSVDATGESLTYQWNKNGGDLSNETNTTYTVASATTNDAGSYTVAVTSGGITITSAVAIVTVADPAITSQPANLIAATGSNAVFNVTAAGSGTLSYLWKKDGVTLKDNGTVVGSKTASLTLKKITTTKSSGSYTVVVSNSVGTATSTGASLSVFDAPLVKVIPPQKTVYAGYNFTMVAKVVKGAVNQGYQWTKNGSPISGATTSALTLTAVQPIDAATYACVVTNNSPTVGSNVCLLTITPDTVAPKLVMFVKPKDMLNKPALIPGGQDANTAGTNVAPQIDLPRRSSIRMDWKSLPPSATRPLASL